VREGFCERFFRVWGWVDLDCALCIERHSVLQTSGYCEVSDHTLDEVEWCEERWKIRSSGVLYCGAGKVMEEYRGGNVVDTKDTTVIGKMDHTAGWSAPGGPVASTTPARDDALWPDTDALAGRVGVTPLYVDEGGPIGAGVGTALEPCPNGCGVCDMSLLLARWARRNCCILERPSFIFTISDCGSGLLESRITFLLPILAS